MRDGLDGPTVELPSDNVAEIRAFLDGQSRIRLAVWVRHEQRGADGPIYDHHLMLGVEDEDWATGDMWALDLGMRLPTLQLGEPTWRDIFPLSEVEALRDFGSVIWEHDPATSTGDDPLDYRHTFEPWIAEPAALERFAVLLAKRSPRLERVEATRQRLWNGDEELSNHVVLYLVGDEGTRHVGSITTAAAAESGVIERCGVQLGMPRDPRVETATIYEAGQ